MIPVRPPLENPEMKVNLAGGGGAYLITHVKRYYAENEPLCQRPRPLAAETIGKKKKRDS